MDGHENNSKAGYTPPIRPSRLVDDGTPEESKKTEDADRFDWPAAATVISFFILVGFLVWVFFG